MEQSVNQQGMFAFALCEAIVLRFDQACSGRSLDEMISLLDHCSDAALWQVLAYRVPYTVYLREHELMIERDSLTLEEEQELEDLTRITVRFMRLRSQVLILLKQRGYDMDRYAIEHRAMCLKN